MDLVGDRRGLGGDDDINRWRRGFEEKTLNPNFEAHQISTVNLPRDMIAD